MRPRSLRTQLLLGTILVIVLVMTAVTVVVDHQGRAGIISEMERRGEALARNFAAISYGPLLLYNFTALEQNVVRMAAEPDVVYAVVLDADGKVAAHSRYPERVGLLLHGAAHERAAGAIEPLTQQTVTNAGEAVYDFAVPVLVDGRKWGTVRLGLSKQRMEAELRRTRLELGALTLVTLLLGSVAAALVAGRIARPVRQLAEGAAAISRGELNQRIEHSTHDEIGRLAAAFNHMAADLSSRDEALRTSNRLRRQMLADVSHELKTPLTAMRGYVETLRMSDVTLSAATRERYFQTLERETRRLDRIVTDLLDLARLENGVAPLDVRLFAIRRVFEHVAARHEYEAGARHIAIGIHVGGETDPLPGMEFLGKRPCQRDLLGR